MELELGELSPDVRDLRTMMDFCCIWRYDYPAGVHQLCRAIGGSSDTLGRCHYQVGTDKRDELTAYARAIEKWLCRKRDEKTATAGVLALQEKIDGKVFSMLGERDGGGPRTTAPAFMRSRTLRNTSGRIVLSSGSTSTR